MSKRYDAGKVITAMVTPFAKNLDVDYEACENLVKHLVKTGSDAVVVSGTTGESPNLSLDEKVEILSTVKRAAANKLKVIFGAGSNSTEGAVKLTKLAQKEGADAILSVVPYYNKPSQQGIIEHFSKIAECTDLPIILYNIPSRTGVNISVDSVKYLSEKYSNIVALKQSFADMDVISELKIACPEDFSIYSGDDSLTLPMMALGVDGVISVASHLWTNEIKTMIHNLENGNYIFAKNMHLKLYPIFKKLFMAPNPVPIKAVLEKKGLIKEYVRLPLVVLTNEEKEELFKVIDDFDRE
jgi:4-hydroxy-tetrahydrodipicolinate synthase